MGALTMAFNDWWAQHFSKGRSKAEALAAWRAQAAKEYAEMRADAHWHDGVPCAQVAGCSRKASS